jgi:SAM-dependent MidA family methyltransferase
MCYNRHKVNEGFYTNIGQQDITSHVNFSALALFASRAGFEFCGFREQGSFLTALGFSELLQRLLQTK